MCSSNKCIMYETICYNKSCFKNLLNIFVSKFFLKFAGPLQSFKSLSYEFHKFTLL